jgi:hypothetical protein
MGIVSKQTVFRRGAKEHATLPYMDGFTACLRGLCPSRSDVTHYGINISLKRWGQALHLTPASLNFIATTYCAALMLRLSGGPK